jgi:hypothetical protein
MFHEPKTLEEAKLYRYRTWAGNSRGDAYNPMRCAAEVADGGRSCLSHQCGRKNGYGPEGLYCKQHSKWVKP